jgi:hypothetical protein
MPEPAAPCDDSNSWRALVELTIETVRPGSGQQSDPARGNR